MDIISDKIVTTRKQHYCSACHRDFPKGTRMRTQVNTYCGNIGTWRECPTCTEILDVHRDEFQDFHGTVEEGCVYQSLEKDETPEMLLERLNLTN